MTNPRLILEGHRLTNSYYMESRFGKKAFLSRDKLGVTYANILSGDTIESYPLSDNSGSKVLLSWPGEFITVGKSPVTVTFYNNGQAESSATFGDSRSRFLDMIMLRDDSILLAFYHFYPPPGEKEVVIQFRHFVGGVWIARESKVVNHSTPPSTRGVLCQHPADDNVWLFTVTDSNRVIHATKLTRNENGILGVGYVNNTFIHKYSDYPREGEFPCVRAFPDHDEKVIRLAYQDRYYEMMSDKYFSKGARVNVVKVDKEGNIIGGFRTQSFIERMSFFSYVCEKGQDIIGGTGISKEHPIANEFYYPMEGGIRLPVNTSNVVYSCDEIMVSNESGVWRFDTKEQGEQYYTITFPLRVKGPSLEASRNKLESWLKSNPAIDAGVYPFTLDI